MIKNFINIIKEKKYMFLIQILTAITYSILCLANPLMFGEILNAVTKGESLKVILCYVSLTSLIILLQIFVARLTGYLGQVIERELIYDLKLKGFKKINKCKISEIEDKTTGELMQVLTQDIEVIAYNSSHLLYTIFINMMTLIGGIFILFFINFYLALFTMIPIPIILYCLVLNKKKQESIRRELRFDEGVISSSLENAINGIQTTKIFANEEFELKKFNKLGNKILKLRRESDLANVKNMYISDFIIDITKCLSYFLAAILIYKGLINVGDFTTYILYVGLFLEPLITNIYIVTELINGNANFESYNNFMNIEEESHVECTTDISLAGNINISNLDFNYKNNNNVLENINISIESGQTVAFVGNSGCGKTTICKLLYKFYDYNVGSISIDGIELKELDYSFLRKNIGVVQQDTYIYATTIKDNVLYGKPTATHEEVIEACKKARLHEFITSLPDGYDTFVGDKGLKLSGGEKQRIAIARILLRDPKIVILDEATSALDNITESYIQLAIDELTRNRTCIVIAHRLSTIENVDKIFVFKDKTVVEEGTHTELLAKNGTYTKLYNRSLN